MTDVKRSTAVYLRALCAGMLLTGAGVRAQAAEASACGLVVTIPTHGGTTMRYTFVKPEGVATALVLLPGGGGHLDLDDRGCPRDLKGNSLVRSLPLFHKAGFATALVDAPSDHTGDDGLAGFRMAADHATDIGRVIADVRARGAASVWLVGTSRGTISGVNAAARLSGAAAPDGIVLTSALMSGFQGGRKEWVAQTVFDAALEEIRVPVLVIGHAEDKCIRSPADHMERLGARIGAARRQIVIVTGGPGFDGPAGVGACIGRSPHGYYGQEAEVAAGIARFVRGERY